MHRSCSQLLLVVVIAAQVQSTSSNFDVAIVIHDGAQWFTKEDYAQYTAIAVTLGQEFPKVFELGDDKTRVAFIANVNGSTNASDQAANGHGVWAVRMPLTGDKANFGAGKLVDNIFWPNIYRTRKRRTDTEKGLGEVNVSWTYPYLSNAFKMAREQVFTGEETKPRAVLVITIPEAAGRGMDGLDGEAKLLRDAGIGVFVVFQAIPNNETETNDRYSKLLQATSGASNIFNLTTGFATDFNNQLLQQIKTEMEKLSFTLAPTPDEPPLTEPPAPSEPPSKSSPIVSTTMVWLVSLAFLLSVA